jgi:hypothetical protein
MLKLTERRAWTHLLPRLQCLELYPCHRPGDRTEMLEDLQLRLEEADCRDRTRRAESRGIRRFIASQPQRAVNLDGVAQPPGQPSWSDDSGPFQNGLPRQFTNDWTNRYEAKRA